MQVVVQAHTSLGLDPVIWFCNIRSWGGLCLLSAPAIRLWLAWFSSVTLHSHSHDQTGEKTSSRHVGLSDRSLRLNTSVKTFTLEFHSVWNSYRNTSTTKWELIGLSWWIATFMSYEQGSKEGKNIHISFLVVNEEWDGGFLMCVYNTNHWSKRTIELQKQKQHYS